MELRKDASHELAAPHFSLHSTLEEVTAVLEVANDDDVSFDQIAMAMESRPLIASTFMKMANSVSLGAARQIRSLRHALALMGLQKIRGQLLEMRIDAIKERNRNNVNAPVN